MFNLNFGGDPPATLRHISPLLRLLPSRSDRVHKLSLRRDRKVTIEISTLSFSLSPERRIMDKASDRCNPLL
jgi:hypothetical protein